MTSSDRYLPYQRFWLSVTVTEKLAGPVQAFVDTVPEIVPEALSVSPLGGQQPLNV
jgi:hypothetical protein